MEFDTFRIIDHKLCRKNHRKIIRKDFLIYFSYFRQSGDDYSQLFNDYPGRFKIEYASPDDVNDLCFKNNHVQYDASVTHRPNRYAVS